MASSRAEGTRGMLLSWRAHDGSERGLPRRVRCSRLKWERRMAGYDRSLYTMYLHQVPMLRSCSQEEIDHIAELGVALSALAGKEIASCPRTTKRPSPPGAGP